MTRFIKILPVLLLLTIPSVALAHLLVAGSVVYLYLENTTNQSIFYSAEFPAHDFRKGGSLEPGEGILLQKRNAVRQASRAAIVTINGQRHQARLKWTYTDPYREREARFFNLWAVEEWNGSFHLRYKSSNTD